MATTGQWEKVGAKGKAKQTKSSKKQIIENMPKIQRMDPVQESTTIYDAFDEDAKKKVKIDKVMKEERIKAQKMNKKNNMEMGDKKSETQKALTIEEALITMDTVDLEDILEQDKTAFPSNPSVWLKDLASVLNLKLEKIPENDPVYEKQPHEFLTTSISLSDFPLRHLSARARVLLSGLIKQCTTDTLLIFLEHCVSSMMTDMGKGFSTYGYRVFIQLVAAQKPSLVLDVLSTYEEHLLTQKNRPMRMLVIHWAVGQFGLRNLEVGVKVWLELMLPMIQNRHVTRYVISYLEKLLSVFTSMKSAYGLIKVDDYFKILDLILVSNALSSTQQKQFAKLYPKIKELAFGSKPEHKLAQFFPLYLRRLNDSCPGNLRQELLDCLTTCLREDKQSFVVWKQVYPKFLVNSSFLLSHLLGPNSSDLDPRALRDLLTHFTRQHDSASLGDSPSQQHVNNHEICSAILDSQRRSRWPFYLFLIIPLLLFGFDCFKHGSTTESLTYKTLKSWGVIDYCKIGFDYLSNTVLIVVSFLQKHVPVWYSKLCVLLKPYVDLIAAKLTILWSWFLAKSQFVMQWLNHEIPPFLELISEQLPGVMENIWTYLTSAWTYVSGVLVVVWQHVVTTWQTAWQWTNENIIKDNQYIAQMLTIATDLWRFLVATSQNIYLWCHERLALWMTSSQ